MKTIQQELRKTAHYLSMRKREQAADCIDRLQAELELCKLPQISIDALVKEFEATPEGLDAVEKGRQWVTIMTTQATAVPIVLYHEADLAGNFITNESCVCKDDVYTDNGDDESIGVPLVRLSDAIASLAAKDAEIVMLRAACAAMVKYDDNDHEDGVQMMFEYNDAITKARAALAILASKPGEPT